VSSRLLVYLINVMDYFFLLRVNLISDLPSWYSYIMPRSYKRKTAPIDHSQIEKCLRHMITNGLGVNVASKECGIPEATLRRYNKKSKAGITIGIHDKLPSVPLDLQAELTMVAKIAASHGFGFTKRELQSFIGEYLKKNSDAENDLGKYLRQHCLFQDFCPRSDWVTSFLKVHNLSLKLPSNMERTRGEAESDSETVNNFYDILQEEMERLGLTDSASSIYNLDETAFLPILSMSKLLHRLVLSVFEQHLAQDGPVLLL
jgi:hypothetical protein